MPLCHYCGKEKPSTDFTPGGLRHQICIECKSLPKETRDQMRTIYLLRTMQMTPSVTPITAVICEHRQPFQIDEPGSLIKELPVSNLMASGDDLPPLPWIFLHITSPPEKRRDMLLNGESQDGIAE